MQYLDNVAGVKIASLAKKIPTPFYLYNQETLQSAAREFRQNLPAATICYAVKANSNLALVQLFAKEGLGADTTSTGELLLALAAGVPAGKIVFSGVGKTVNGLTVAIKNNIKQINVESEQEFETIAQMARAFGKKANISIRVNPDVDAKTHKKVTTGTKHDKFGLSWPRALALYKKAAKTKGINVVGISIHIGSQIMALKPFEQAFARLAGYVRALDKAKIKIQNIDVGGGLGVAYKPGKDTPIKIADYAALINKHFAPLGRHIIVEPGRRLVADAGALISKVLYTKKGEEGKNFLIIDAGMNDLIRPAMYGSHHEIVPCARAAKRAQIAYDVVGPVCESSDTFAKDRSFGAPLKRGDIVAILTAGAYGSSMSSNYNMHPITGEVLANGGAYQIIRARKPYAQMIKEQAADITRPQKP